MTQEDKELLLKDLCARLPYGVIIKHKDEHGRSIDARLVGYNGDWFNYYYIDNLCFHLKIHEFKPYLRPMSSMTEEELHEYNIHLLGITIGVDAMNFMIWIYQRHLDILHFIEKGLALEAPKGIYELKEL